MSFFLLLFLYYPTSIHDRHRNCEQRFLSGIRSRLRGLQLVLLKDLFLKINQSALSTADFVPNTSDEEGRYSYENQPNVGFFNLEKLLQAMKPLLEDYSA